MRMAVWWWHLFGYICSSFNGGRSLFRFQHLEFGRHLHRKVEIVLFHYSDIFSKNEWEFRRIYFFSMAPEMLTIVDRPNISDWSLENGYIDVANKSSYPIHVYSSQKHVELLFDLRAEDIDVEYICKTLVPGFKIFLHTPGDVLKSSDVSIRVPFSEEVHISITPRMITTAKGLRKYEPSQRQCYFNSERHLRFFKFYSPENCETECLANYTVQECRCVKFSMPSNRHPDI